MTTLAIEQSSELYKMTTWTIFYWITPSTRLFILSVRKGTESFLRTPGQIYKILLNHFYTHSCNI